jgi:hypothetical protein
MEQLDPQTLTTINQAQALAVFTNSGEANRFLQGQMWQVTYLILLAYGALVVAPERIFRNGAANWVCIAANLFCAVLASVAAVLAHIYLGNLDGQAGRRLEEVRAAAQTWLPVVVDLHGWRCAPPPNPGRIIWLLQSAVWIGALLVICINLTRIPRVVGWLNRWRRGHTT